ncbi:MAG: hypothetical protein WC762_01600 [Methylobacter sp.]|jgi:hypothetical protein
MSNEDNSKKTIETAQAVVGNLVSSMMNLKEKNPKVFFGAVGGVVLLLIIMMMSGGDSKPSVSKYSAKSLSVGQQYVLKNPNALEEGATIRLVAMPGAIAAYDDEDDDKGGSPCKHLPEGTPVTVVDFQDAYGKKDAFVKVKVEDGECQGNEGWVLSIDVQ